MDKIIYGILLFILTGVIAFITKKYFLKRPKLSVEIKSHFCNSSAPNDYNIIQLVWHKYFCITNSTSHKACNVRVYFLTNANEFKIKIDNMLNIDPFMEKQFDLEFKTNNQREVVLKVKERSIDLLPDFYKNMLVLIEYKNDYNKRYYTLFSNNDNGEKNKFYFFKPRKAT
jgi:hypothetical protein